MACLLTEFCENLKHFLAVYIFCMNSVFIYIKKIFQVGEPNIQISNRWRRTSSTTRVLWSLPTSQTRTLKSNFYKEMGIKSISMEPAISRIEKFQFSGINTSREKLTLHVFLIGDVDRYIAQPSIESWREMMEGLEVFGVTGWIILVYHSLAGSDTLRTKVQTFFQLPNRRFLNHRIDVFWKALIIKQHY